MRMLPYAEEEYSDMSCNVMSCKTQKCLKKRIAGLKITALLTFGKSSVMILELFGSPHPLTRFISREQQSSNT